MHLTFSKIVSVQFEADFKFGFRVAHKNLHFFVADDIINYAQ